MATKTDEPWDPEALRQQFFRQSDNAENYIQENLGRIKRNDPRAMAAQTMVDFSSAERDLCVCLAGSSAVSDRAALVAELKRLHQSPPKSVSRDVKDKTRYDGQWANNVNVFLKRFDI